MSNYTELAPRRSNSLFRVKISNHPISNLKREFDVHGFFLNGNSVGISGTVDYIDEDERVIEMQSIKSYDVALIAEKNGITVNQITGEREEQELDEEGNQINQVISRHQYMVELMHNVLPFSIFQILINIIKSADEDTKEFDV